MDLKVALFEPTHPDPGGFLYRSDRSCAGDLGLFLLPRTTDVPAFRPYRDLRASAQLVFDDVRVLKPAPLELDDRVSRLTRDVFHGCERLRAQDPTIWVEALTGGRARAVLFDEVVAAPSTPVRQAYAALSGEARDEVARAFDAAFEAFYPFATLVADDADGEHLFLSPLDDVNLAAQRLRPRVTPSGVLAVLAMSGLRLALPRVYCDDDEALSAVREKFAEEREAYVNHLRGFVSDCYEQVRDGKYDSAWQFAEAKADVDLAQKLSQFESAVAKGDRTLLRSIRIGLTEDAPSILQSCLTKDYLGAGIGLFKILCRAFGGETAEGRARGAFPMVSYLYDVKRAVGT